MFNKSNSDYDNDLSKQLEAILFYKGDEVSFSLLIKILAVRKKEILNAIKLLEERLKNSALSIIYNDSKILMTTSREYGNVISQLKGEEKLGELSSSALETLSIILYRGPVSKSEIDEIRGINSSYILRNLLIRGLVERKNVEGKNIYEETLDLMRYLAIDDKKNLPGYEKVIEKLNQIDKAEEYISTEKDNNKK